MKLAAPITRIGIALVASALYCAPPTSASAQAADDAVDDDLQPEPLPPERRESTDEASNHSTESEQREEETREALVEPESDIGEASAEAPVPEPPNVPPSPYDETVTSPPRTPTPEAEPSGQAIREEGARPSIPPRDVPDYDGRPERAPTAEEGLLWIPRILFFPVHAVLEYLIRIPLGEILTWAEREDIPVAFINLFTFGDSEEQNGGVVPTAFIDFGFQPSGGLYIFVNNFLAPGNALRATLAVGGEDWLRGTLSDRIRLSDIAEISFTFDAWRRPDYIFHGLGPDSRFEDRSRYIRSFVDGDVTFRLRPWRASEIRLTGRVSWNDFNTAGYAFLIDEPTLAEAVSQGRFEAPPGLDGYVSYEQRLDIAIDSREARPAPGHGIRVEAYAEHGVDLTRANERRWLGYGGALGGFLDLSANRVLGLWALARFVDPLGTDAVPFTEQVFLGGEPLVMDGYLPGTLIGRSAAVATLEYRYPIWAYMDASLHVSVGNVFGNRLRDFDVEKLRVSWGLGLRTIDRDQAFSVLIAFGSDTFERGANIDSVRFVFGAQQGF